MQHPVGYVINNGRAEMVDFVAVISNPKVWYEFSHVIMGAFTLGGMAVAGMVAFQLLKKTGYFIPQSIYAHWLMGYFVRFNRRFISWRLANESSN